MTTGQRIAQKRKELELSQEALGAELGVSRQSIYKWVFDAALPEIDKLVALSRRFGRDGGLAAGGRGRRGAARRRERRADGHAAENGGGNCGPGTG
ncbi:MAG: helix-turn-helix transcriptional regulator [Oscillospiraceae bacterium]